MSKIITFLLLILPCILYNQQLVGLNDIDKKSRKRFEQALSCIKKKEYDKGINTLEDLVKKYPEFLLAHKHLAKNYIRSGNKEQAFSNLKAIDYLSRDIDIPFKMTLADLYEEKAMLDSAVLHISLILNIPDLTQKQKEKIEFRLEELKFRRDAYSSPIDVTIDKLGEGVNTRFDEYHPGMNAESTELVFVRGTTEPGSIRTDEDLFSSTVVNDSFSVSQPILNVNTSFNEGAHSYSEDGTILVFTSCYRNDGYGGCDLYISFRKQEGWTEPVNMGSGINTSAWESQPSICNNNRTIYFSSNRAGGYGGSDIWRIDLDENNQWGDVVNLGPEINTQKDETGPFMHPDNLTLYFRSNGHIGLGDFDIFFTKRIGENDWGDPVNMGYPINSPKSESALFIDLEGDYAYFSSNKDSDNQDIYRFTLPDIFKPDRVSYIKILIKDATTNSPLKSTVNITGLDNDYEEKRKSDLDGKLIQTLKKGNYQLTVSHPEYVFHSENAVFSGEGTEWKPYIYEIALQKIPVENVESPPQKAIVLNNIFFATGSSELLEQSEPEIHTLYEFLIKNDKISIRISGHTDNVGAEDDNLKLSEARARAVYDALISKGISHTRLSYLGHGEKMPVASNETKEGRQTNRRTEFIIID